MIDMPSEAPAAAPAQAPEWLTMWERPSPQGVTCGVQARLSRGKKLYRAFAWVTLDEVKRLESDTFEACDAADVDESRMRHGSVVPEHVQMHEMALREAEQARALITEKQRSPKDMRAIAHELAEQLWHEANEYNRLADLAEQQRLYDAEAARHFDLWYRGGEVRFGEEAMKRLFGHQQKR